MQLFRKQLSDPSACLSVVSGDFSEDKIAAYVADGYEIATDESLAEARAWASQMVSSGEWTPAPQPTPESLPATPADIAAYRYEIEQGGVSVVIAGTPHRFDTTRENRSMWLAIRLEAEANASLSHGWKTLDGEFVMLTAADVLTVCAAVYAHVAACFGAEAVLLANPPTLADLPAAFASALTP